MRQEIIGALRDFAESLLWDPRATYRVKPVLRAARNLEAMSDDGIDVAVLNDLPAALKERIQMIMMRA